MFLSIDDKNVVNRFFAHARVLAQVADRLVHGHVRAQTGVARVHQAARFILGATLELDEDDPERIMAKTKEIWMYKRNSQPLNTKNCGCIFKNPRGLSAGALIDQAGLKGTRVGGAEVSTKHANFIVAHPGCRAADVHELIRVIRDKVYEKNQLVLAFMAEDTGEAQRAAIEGTESFAAKHGTESPAIGEQLMEEVCERLATTELPNIDPAARVWFRDVLDHSRRALARMRGLKETLASIVETASLLEQHRQGEMTRQLASWAAILAVPTAIAGIYGMNFEFMPELHWRYGYFAAIGLIVAVCAGLWWRFKRIGWL